MHCREAITGLVLAGGQGSRMGGIDKGLQLFQGRALAQHALLRLQPQVAGCMINANRNIAAYEDFGVSVHADILPDYPGPLAGFITGLHHCHTPWLLTVPCDSPRFPLDLAQRMARTAQQAQALVVLAAGLQPNAHEQFFSRPQPVFALIHASLRDDLQAFIAAGGRKIDAWTANHPQALCHFDQPQDDVYAFANANTLQELHWLEQQN